MGAVLVRGPKWCGKTTTAGQIAESSVFMSDAKKGAANRQLAAQRPDRLLVGKYPRLIDEWQEVPSLWDAVRSTVDDSRMRGQFILTGSAVPPQVDEEDERCEIRHTGTGRIARLTMRTMTLWESGDSQGTVSFADLFEGQDVIGESSALQLEDVAEAICRGGWPGALGLSGRAARGPAREYYEAICDADISRVDGTLRDPIRVRSVMKSLARLQPLQLQTTTASTMLPSDHFVRFYNEVFKYIIAKGPAEIRKYYDRVSKNQEYHCLNWFREKGLRGMYEYWEHSRVEENCDMANHLEDDCYWFEFFSCPSLSKAVDNDAGPCPEYCNHCPGWILPIMTKVGYYAVYNLISRTEPRCMMFVYREKAKAESKKAELVAKYGTDVILDNL